MANVSLVLYRPRALAIAHRSSPSPRLKFELTLIVMSLVTEKMKRLGLIIEAMNAELADIFREIEMRGKHGTEEV